MTDILNRYAEEMREQMIESIYAPNAILEALRDPDPRPHYHPNRGDYNEIRLDEFMVAFDEFRSKWYWVEIHSTDEDKACAQIGGHIRYIEPEIGL